VPVLPVLGRRCWRSARPVVTPHLRAAYPANLAAAVEEIGRLRWTLRQVITLTDDAPTITAFSAPGSVTVWTG